MTATAANAAGFEVIGELSYTGTRSNHFTRRFHVLVNDCRWTISTWSETLGGGRMITTATLRGTNVHVRTWMAESPLDPHGEGVSLSLPDREPIDPPGNERNRKIISGPMPEADSSFITALWLMFASGCVLDEQGNQGMLKPIWLADRTETAALAPAEWTRHERWPRLPTQVNFRSAAGAGPRASFAATDFQTGNGLAIPRFGRLAQPGGAVIEIKVHRFKTGAEELFAAADPR